jgi:hypothetical protein
MHHEASLRRPIGDYRKRVNALREICLWAAIEGQTDIKRANVTVLFQKYTT